MGTLKPNFDIIIAEDYHNIRYCLAQLQLPSLLAERGLPYNIVNKTSPPNEEACNIIAVANPSQLAEYFNQHRDDQRNLLVISDRNMPMYTTTNYDDTACKAPASATIMGESVHLFNLIKDRRNDVKVFYVERSGDIDEVMETEYDHLNPNHATPIGQISSMPENNFDMPYRIAKGMQMRDENRLLTTILDHCDKLFAV